jgi:IS605 OrfB family transposase
MSLSNHTFTFGTRIAPDPFLVGMAKRCSEVERHLHAHLMRGGKLDQALKDKVMKDTGLPGRYYNGITTVLQGKIDAVRELRKLDVAKTEERIKRVTAKVKSIGEDLKALHRDATHPMDPKTSKRLQKLWLAAHGKKRKLSSLKHRLKWLNADMARPVPSLCFGSKRLFRKQFNLKENGYANHAEWLVDWRSARSAQFMIPGSHDEVGGNKTCTATVSSDGGINLRVLVPENMRVGGEQHFHIRGLRFGYGHDDVVRAILAAEDGRGPVLEYQAETKRLVAQMRADNAALDEGTALDEDALKLNEATLRKTRNADIKKERAGHSTALTWRFMHDGSGWLVHVGINRRLEGADWGFAHGAIGIDLNVGFVSIMPIDGTGNPLPALSCELPFEATSLSSERGKAVMGDMVKQAVEMALAQRRPIIIEKLNFQKKFAALKELFGPKLARRLSSFAYSLFKAMLHSRAARFGVRVIEVEPAYTSHMGRAKYARSLGISVHRAAAAMIARRGMGLSEGLFASAELPLGDGRHVALHPPERMGRRHVWRSWGKHFGRYNAKRKALDVAARKSRSAQARISATVPACARSQKSGNNPACTSRPGSPGPQHPTAARDAALI